jgi:hypothetical protein
MKASLVAYDFRKQYKSLELKLIKYVHVRGCPNSKQSKFGSLKFYELTPKGPRVFLLKIVSKQSLLKASQVVQN